MTKRQEIVGRRLAACALVIVLLTAHAGTCLATVLVTSDLTQVALFQTGATVENFDSLAALTITSYAAGQTVPAANQFVSRNPAAFTAPFFNSGGASFNDPVSNPGTPIGIFDPDGAIASEVVSPNNVAGPLAFGSDEAFNNGFMEVVFPADVQRVGFWVTQGTVTMFLKDANNSNLTTGDDQVTGSAGEFIGIVRDSADARGLTIGFPEAFTIDDFTYAAQIPEPASIVLFALGMAILCLRWRARSSSLGGGAA